MKLVKLTKLVFMALGKGLASLIPQLSGPAAEPKKVEPVSAAKRGQGRPRLSEARPAAEETEVVPEAAKSDRIFYIELEKIKPNPYQPRRDFKIEELKSLADSMKEYGMLQPLLVSKLETSVASGTRVEYQLIAGERRLRAAEMAGLRQAPVVIKNPSEINKLEMAVIENIQRQDLNPIEEAMAFRQMIDEFGLTHAQLGARLGLSAASISNKVRLMDLPQEVKALVMKGKMSEGHAKSLLAAKNPERQRYLVKQVLETGMTVRMLEDLIKHESEYRPQPSRANLDSSLVEYKRMIQESLGTMVKIVGSRNKGHITLAFYSEEDLAKMVKRLTV